MLPDIDSAMQIVSVCFAFVFSFPRPTLTISVAVDLFNGHYYQMRSDFLSYFEAMELASSLLYQGVVAHLVTITTQAESDFISNSQYRGWIGTTDLWQTNNFAYTTGPERYTPIRFSNWASGMPSTDVSLNCVFVESHLWLSGPCSQQLPFIVEFECPPGLFFGLSGCEGLELNLSFAVIILASNFIFLFYFIVYFYV